MALPASQHAFWEGAGVLLGIYLIITGVLLFLRGQKIIGGLNVLFGIISVIVDGFIFLPHYKSCFLLVRFRKILFLF